VQPPRIHVVTPWVLARALAAAGGPGRLLTDSEQAALDALTLERRRRDWLAGRLAAKRAVRAVARARGEAAPPWATISVLNSPDGAPWFVVDGRPELGTEWNISIAHDDGFAVCAIARTARAGFVGVDIERDRPLALHMLRYVLTPAERSRITDAKPAAAPAPLAVWTAKEAVVKAARGGVCDAMRQVELSWSGGGALTARIVEGGSAARRARLRVACGRSGAHLLAWATCRADRSGPT
jgi:4'-phosphopantetheinyl transferase